MFNQRLGFFAMTYDSVSGKCLRYYGTEASTA